MPRTMSKFLMITAALFLFSFTSIAQPIKVVNRAHLRVGANYAFQGGTNIENVLNPDFAHLQFTAFLGYRFDHKTRTANSIGVFATMGGIPQASITQMRNDNAFSQSFFYNNGESTRSLEFEGGFIFGDWFRLSAGPGTLFIPQSNGNTQQLKYYSGTAGITIKLGSLTLNSTAGMQFGGDIKTPTYRVGVGAGFAFSFIKSVKPVN